MANKKVYKIELKNMGSGFSSRPARYYYNEGTLDELVKAYGYTLEVGDSYAHEKGNYKINVNPKGIKSLINNLNKAVNNAAANGYAGKYYSEVALDAEEKGRK